MGNHRQYGFAVRLMGRECEAHGVSSTVVFSSVHLVSVA